MRTTSKFLALALTATMQSAMAGAVFLDFEDIKTTDPLAGVYNGVNVSGNAWGATSEACGDPFGVSFTRAGSCGALWLAKPDGQNTGVDQSLTLSLTNGFIDALSFVYSGSTLLPNLQVHVYDATGNELAKVTGLQGATGCNTYKFCNWSDTVSLTFTGVARSVTFTALDQTVLIDDVSFTTPTATTRLPEPASIALTLGALGALGWTRKRAAR